MDPWAWALVIAVGLVAVAILAATRPGVLVAAPAALAAAPIVLIVTVPVLLITLVVVVPILLLVGIILIPVMAFVTIVTLLAIPAALLAGPAQAIVRRVKKRRGRG